MGRVHGETMGTTWSATIVEPPQDAAREIEAVLAGVVGQMSHWEAASQLSRFNAAPVGGWHRIDPGFVQVMQTALDIASRSGGAFEPAIGGSVDLWGFGPPGPRDGLPTDDEVCAAHAASGHDALELDSLLLRLRRTRPARLDLSGIAKGYAVDAVAARLRALGCSDFLIEIGGELSGAGIQPDGQPWWVDVEIPPGLSMPPLRVALHGLAIATSGDYRRAAAQGSHTIDPRTGRPLTNHVASVTVLHPSCMHADAWASALTVLGPEPGMELATREGLAAHIAVRSERTAVEHLSPALHAMLD